MTFLSKRQSAQTGCEDTKLLQIIRINDYEKDYCATYYGGHVAFFMRHHITIRLIRQRTEIPGRHIQQFPCIHLKGRKGGLKKRDRRARQQDKGVKDIPLRRQEGHHHDTCRHVGQDTVRPEGRRNCRHHRREPVRLEMGSGKQLRILLRSVQSRILVVLEQTLQPILEFMEI